ncbi:MAG TPA: hypothetical protein DIT97_06255 [Gimesia maris]|uniref:Uncharacterized protein n=1 Tax=Gimesia maris TaxID=122 RepID=A0A3D3R1H3_9PLAN|nr:hypothetical protein [Gimesia maris]
MIRERKIVSLIILLMQAMIGTACESEDQRLARLATEYADRQAEQGSQVIDLQQELMTGSRQLIEADSRARTEMIDLHREIQEERRSLDLRHEQLEAERRSIERNRFWAPYLIDLSRQLFLLVACLLPLMLCRHLLTLALKQGEEALIGEQLLEDIVSDDPVLIPSKATRLILEDPTELNPPPEKDAEN